MPKEEILEIKVNRKIVFRESTDYLPDLKAQYFATKEEIKNADYVDISNLDKNDCSRDEKGDSFCDAVELPISILKEVIEKAEKAGANFIAVDFHCDHIEYDIYGFQVARATPAELEMEKQKSVNKKKADKEAQIQELETKLKKLKGE